MDKKKIGAGLLAMFGFAGSRSLLSRARKNQEKKWIE